MGGSTQTSTSTTTPLSGQVQPTLDKLLGGVQQAYDAGPTKFDQSLYVPSGGTTQSSWGSLINAANNPTYNDAVSRGIDSNNRLMQTGGLTTGMQDNIGTVNNATSGYGNFARNGLTSGMQGNIADVNGIGQGYAGLAGAYDQNAPGYDTMRTNLLNDAVKNVGQGFIGSGRFGGKSYIDSATTAGVNAIAPLDYQNFQNGIANQYRSLDSRLNAANTAFGMGQTGVGNQLSGLAGQLSGANTTFGMGQTGVGNTFAAQNQLPGLYNALMQPGQTLGQVGAAQDANALAERQGAYDLNQRQGNAQTDLLAKLSSILAGNAAAGGSQTTSTQPSTPWWQTAAGLGLGALSLL